MSTTTMSRSNRVSVSATEVGYEAKFFKTHNLVGTINSADTSWVADEKMNKTAQREAFRVWICDNSTAYGIQWLPDDMRTSENRRQPKYTSDEVLLTDVKEFLAADVERFWNERNLSNLGLSYTLTGDSITPVTKSAKGKDVEPKYGNGNWAWASVDALVTITYGNEEAYVTLTCELVSGQLKKPSGIDGGAYSSTGFANTVNKELNTLNGWKEKLAKEEAEREQLAKEKSEANAKAHKEQLANDPDARNVVDGPITGEDIRSEAIAEREEKSNKRGKRAAK